MSTTFVMTSTWWLSSARGRLGDRRRRVDLAALVASGAVGRRDRRRPGTPRAGTIDPACRHVARPWSATWHRHARRRAVHLDRAPGSGRPRRQGHLGLFAGVAGGRGRDLPMGASSARPLVAPLPALRSPVARAQPLCLDAKHGARHGACARLPRHAAARVVGAAGALSPPVGAASATPTDNRFDPQRSPGGPGHGLSR